VHLIADKDRTQDELFVLFNLLYESGRQMVFTSSVPLAELTGVEPRLRTRMEGGLVVTLPPPRRRSAPPW
jgi:chromosomal replication initiator protein